MLTQLSLLINLIHSYFQKYEMILIAEIILSTQQLNAILEMVTFIYLLAHLQQPPLEFSLLSFLSEISTLIGLVPSPFLLLPLSPMCVEAP